jgi:hypothetical protein
VADTVRKDPDGHRSGSDEHRESRDTGVTPGAPEQRRPTPPASRPGARATAPAGPAAPANTPVPDPAGATTVGEYVDRLERVAAHQSDAGDFGGRA